MNFCCVNVEEWENQNFYEKISENTDKLSELLKSSWEQPVHGHKA